MAVHYEEVTITGQGVSLSQLVWRRANAPYPGQLEAVLDANIHLADLGFVLPVGTVVRLPPAPADAGTETVAPIRLW